MSPNEQTVLITGASSGIGRATALHLDRLGFQVFAGVRKDEDAAAISQKASERLSPVMLDVTDDESIAAAVARITEATSGQLFGLVNNAGLSLNGPLEMVPMSDIRKLMDVNVVGLLAVTKASLPLLRAGGGRIVNISSGHGLLAIPDKSVYAASKFAVQAISDSLRLELKPLGLSVSCLEVGKVDTEVLGKIVTDREAMIRTADADVVELYRPLIEFFDREVKELPGVPPEVVAEAVARTLMAERPRAHAQVGPGARKMRNLARLPIGLRDRLLHKAIYDRRLA
jgi:NAD(P)-dependent dehydrogenase (short-subunit alcohol dehydrogenase family)